MFTVAVVAPFHEEGLKLLRDRSDIDLRVITDLSPEGVAKGVTGADAITIRTAPLPKEALALAPALRVVSRHGVGYDNVDVAYLSSRKIPMALAVDSNYTAVAEYTLMMMLALAKDAFAGDAAVRSGDFNWRSKGTISDIAEKNVLIMGFGRIGQRVAKLCQAFDMKVTAYDPYVASSPVPGVAMTGDFRAALPETDYLCLHMPSTPETLGMIGPKELETMKNSAFIVNCARGGMIDENLLAGALEAGKIRGVGMDVFAAEPHNHNDPLFKQKRCVFSPHSAALSVECSIRMAKQTAQNVLDCLDGKLAARVVVNRKEIGME